MRRGKEGLFLKAQKEGTNTHFPQFLTLYSFLIVCPIALILYSYSESSLWLVDSFLVGSSMTLMILCVCVCVCVYRYKNNWT